MEDERNYWPIRLLKDFARMPIETESWAAWGHSFSQEEEEPFAEGVSFHIFQYALNIHPYQF